MQCTQNRGLKVSPGQLTEEIQRFSMIEGHTYNGESRNLKKCSLLGISVRVRWPAWNDLKLHKCKGENKRKQHLQTTLPQQQSERKVRWCNSNLARDSKKRWECGKMTCICNNSAPMAKGSGTSYLKVQGAGTSLSPCTVSIKM